MNGSDPQVSRRSHKTSDEAIDSDFLIKMIAGIAILVTLLALLGRVELMIDVMVVVCIGIAWWALRLHEQSMSQTDRFAALRRVVRLQNKDAKRPSPLVVFGIATIVGVFFCWNLSTSWKQFQASDLPMVQGTITRRETVDVDLGYQLKVEYDYHVAGKAYHGNRLRFVYRAFRVGTDDAKKLAATWRRGNTVSVFYNPDFPDDCVLDNTFCKGDKLQVGLNATGFMLSIMVVFGAVAWQHGRESELVMEDSGRSVAIPLSNLPLIGTFAVLLAIISLILTFIALVGGFMSMGDSEIPWLVKSLEWLFALTGTLFGIAIAISLGERASFGFGGRNLLIDRCTNRISWPSETFGAAVGIDFENLKAVRVVSNREDWLRFGRTFSVVISYFDLDSCTQSKTVQRSYERRRAVALVAAIRRIVYPNTHNVSISSSEPCPAAQGDFCEADNTALECSLRIRSGAN